MDKRRNRRANGEEEGESVFVWGEILVAHLREEGETWVGFVLGGVSLD